MTTEAETRGRALQRLIATFTAAGLDTPDLDARLLLAHVLGVDRLRLLTERDLVLPVETGARLADTVARRLAHEPVSRIIGERWFYGRPFKVTPATLDPRPDSEVLIEAARTLMQDAGRANGDVRVLDIGTGTGCLLLSLVCELPGVLGYGTDISPDALAVAEENRVRLSSRSDAPERERADLQRIQWRLGADYTPVRGETFDLIVSNPPYIPRADIADLEPDVRQYDPHLALDGGLDGLDVYRRLCAGAADHLSDGWILFEVGVGQASLVADMLQAAFSPRDIDLRVFDDLAGVPRCVAASPRPMRLSARPE